MTGPTDAQLRAASAGLQAAALASLIPAASDTLHLAVREQDYLIQAQALGVDPDEARRVLHEVFDELAAGRTVDADPYAIARKRLIETANGIPRPPEELREAVRQLFAAGGYAPHPDAIDAWARHLQGPGADAS